VHQTFDPRFWSIEHALTRGGGFFIPPYRGSNPLTPATQSGEFGNVRSPEKSPEIRGIGTQILPGRPESSDFRTIPRANRASVSGRVFRMSGFQPRRPEKWDFRTSLRPTWPSISSRAFGLFRFGVSRLVRTWIEIARFPRWSAGGELKASPRLCSLATKTCVGVKPQVGFRPNSYLPRSTRVGRADRRQLRAQAVVKRAPQGP
jgi:hypothetical protein